MPYTEIFAAFPSELRLPVARLVDALKAEIEVRRSDFEPLQAAVQNLVAAQSRTEVRMEELAAAQVRTEARLDQLTVAVEGLTAAQARTEVRMEELAAAQARTEVRMEELAAAQVRTEARLDQLTVAVEGLTAAQTHMQDELTLFRRTFTSQIGSLGARWGMQTEEAFRHGIRTILGDVGFTTERFLTWDAAGEVFGHPDQVELDVVIRNGAVIVVEIKSSLDRANTYLFDRKVAFYARYTGQQVTRKVVVASYADERAREVARRLGIEICTEATEFA